MKKSRYEQFKDDAMKSLIDAMKEEKYIRDTEYIIVLRNVTDKYNVDFTRTFDGDWADEVYEQICDISIECALSNKGTKYIAILAKCYLDGSIDFLKESHICIDSRN